MAHIGHPCRDKVYGGTSAGKVAGMKVPRQMLHARLLGFKHPRTGEYMEFTAEIPPDMEKVLDILRRKKMV
jgi:23S rRNA pseudouridine1911/1915/1917 synthase